MKRTVVEVETYDVRETLAFVVTQSHFSPFLFSEAHLYTYTYKGEMGEFEVHHPI